MQKTALHRNLKMILCNNPIGQHIWYENDSPLSKFVTELRKGSAAENVNNVYKATQNIHQKWYSL